MNLVLCGLSLRSAPAAFLDALCAFGAGRALRDLRAGGWPEAVVLATCNRFEAAAAARGGEEEAALLSLRALMEGWAGAALGGSAYALAGRAAAGHLFAVASGLDSLVVGETEILGQVKSAYEAARSEGMTGRLLNVAFQRALFVGKLVRARTGIASGGLSAASVAAALAGRVFGDLSSCRVLILGAGRMACVAAKHLAGRGAAVWIANRTRERAAALAADLRRRMAAAGSEARADDVAWEDFPSRLGEADIVVASTGAPAAVLTAAGVRAAMARRSRSLFIIDIAMPRDVEDGVGALDNVYLYTLADLDGIVRENLSRRQDDLALARRLVEERAAEFAQWLAAGHAGGRVALRHGGRASDSRRGTPGEEHDRRPGRASRLLDQPAV